MSLFSALNVGAAGLGVTSTWMNVIGDNIANLNTTGYKGGRASFVDFLPQHVFGVNGGGQVGAGAATSRVNTMLGQGSFDTTDNALDMAIDGSGFFVVSDGTQDFYTRSGEFSYDDEGYVVSGNGMRVQGYSGDGVAVSAALGDLKLPTTDVPGTPTANIVLETTLSAGEDVATDVAGLDFFGTGTGASTLVDAGTAAQFTSSTTIYDSRGVGHDVTVLYERSGANDWSWRAVVDASEAYDSTGTQFSTDTGYGFEVASGTLTFDTDGVLTGSTQTDTATATIWNFGGTDTPSIFFDFGLDSTGVETDGVVSMSGEESALTAIAQDGTMSGQLTGISVGTDGTLTGAYSNGEAVEIGRVGLASFQAPQGLERVGGALFRATPDAGQAAVGMAGTGGRGSIAGNALEKSNVDLEGQFVSMITAQRSYQASSKVISTANETLQTLMQLI
ncbi:MAG: flagellar hook protein FlgE [Myxococcales bacterium]|nr:flagellar hook protein FlgE [Myxococcales bacterium]